MKTLNEVQVKGEYFFLVSLSKLVGKPIKDIQGYISKEFGEPVFQVSRVILEDGTSIAFNGEHDIAYLEDYNHVISQEQLQALYDEENPSESIQPFKAV